MMTYTMATNASRPWVAWGVVVLLVVAGGVLLMYRNAPSLAQFLGARSETPSSTATYACDEGKTIAASFYTHASGSSVLLVLSDGRKMSLPQTISASGARYAKDDSFVFWNKGNTAFIEEGADARQTFAGCMGASGLPTHSEWNMFASSTLRFSIRYPQGYTQTSYAQRMGQEELYGVKFTIPALLTDDTNLAGDTGVSVETGPQSCSAAAFLPKMLNRQEWLITDQGVDYIVATSTDAAAGNRYEEIVYVRRGSDPCLAVRYFIHFGNIQNYEQAEVREFDRAALLREFDQIRYSIVAGQ